MLETKDTRSMGELQQRVLAECGREADVYAAAELASEELEMELQHEKAIRKREEAH